MIFPYAPSYREAIYRLMDETWDIDWYFAENCDPHLKLLDYPVLKRVDLSLKERRIGPFSNLKGVGALKLENYDAIIIPGVFRCLSDVKMILRHTRGEKPHLYLWTHGWYGKETRFEKAIKKFLYPRVDGIFLYGNRAKQLMVEEGFESDRLHVIHNSLDYSKQLALRKSITSSDIYASHFKNSDKVLIFIGRLTAVKRLELLVEALSELKEKGEKYNLIFVGDGDERKNLENSVIEKNLENQVWFYGQCFDETKNAELIFNADLCVSPGNVGLTAIHSLMFGCPVMSNDDFKTQMPEFEVIIKDKTGDFFKAYEASDLARSISKWFALHLNDRDLVRQKCFEIIDGYWNPNYQLNILKQVLN